MRDLFPGFYGLSEEDEGELWQNALFAFDANVLLGLYRYTPRTRRLLLKQLTGLQKRLFLPHRVAFEYQRGRLRVIGQQRKAYMQTTQAVERVVASLEKEFKSLPQRHPYIALDDVKTEFAKTRDKVKKSLKRLEEKHPDFLTDDTVRKRLELLFDGRVGERPNDYRSMQQEAERRMGLLLPPGYEDSGTKQGEDRLGDALVWLQLLEEASKQEKPVIFVTDETKEDWWGKESDRPSPRPELLQEMREVAGVGFWMYSAPDFIRRASKFLEEPDESEADAAILEVEEVNRPVQLTPSELSAIDQPAWLRGLGATAFSEELFRQWREIGIGSSLVEEQMEGLRAAHAKTLASFVALQNPQVQESVRRALSSWSLPLESQEDATESADEPPPEEK